MSIVRASSSKSLRTGNTPIRFTGAALALMSQVIHLWILPGEFVVTLVPGLFFLVVGISQGLLGISLLFGSRKWALRLGVMLNLLIVTVWGITRIISLPAITGSAQFNIGVLGIGSVAVEIALIVILLKLHKNRK
ncbi:hypothetical protein [Natrinema salinisoli]|uniref:hypothetical protein n=1 Tax=Natrinema salinisoli TaxID=2878535 RepID=UPI001CF072EC|nr:hypothetical protein [Natrinema salinisoli]